LVGGGRYESLGVESSGLLALCLRAIPALKKQKSSEVSLEVLDAGFIWTEPHSMRIKLKLTLKGILTAMNNLPIKQRVMVELRVMNKQCQDCQKQFQNQTWMGLVQLRQRRPDGSKKGLAVVEAQLSRSPDVRRNIYNIETSRNGFDFYFASVR